MKKIINKIINLKWVLIALLIPLYSISVNAETASNDSADLFRAIGQQQSQLVEEAVKNNIDPISEILYLKESTNSGAALTYLKMAFGDWVTFKAEDAGNISIITFIAGYTNLLALILGVTLLIYVTYSGVINTAATGEFLGKSGWSKVWLPFRTALAFGLIIPLGGTSTWIAQGEATAEGQKMAGGYLSPVQIATIYIARVGSGFADYIWSGAVNYVAGNGQILSVQAPNSVALEAANSASLVAAAACGYSKHVQSLKTDKIVYPISVSVAELLKNSATNKIYNKYTTYRVDTSQPSSTGSHGLINNFETYEELFLAVNAELEKGKRISEIVFAPNSNLVCGSVGFGDNVVDSGSGSSIQNDAGAIMNEAYLSSLERITLNLLQDIYSDKMFKEGQTVPTECSVYSKPLLETMVSSAAFGGLQSLDDEEKAKLNPDVNKEMSDLINNNKVCLAKSYADKTFNYVNNVSKCLTNLSDLKTSTIPAGCPTSPFISKFKEKADPNAGSEGTKFLKEYTNMLKTGGWAQAGLWYFELSRLSNMSNATLNTFTSSIYYDPTNEELARKRICENEQKWADANEGFSGVSDTVTPVNNCKWSQPILALYTLINDVHEEAVQIVTDGKTAYELSRSSGGVSDFSKSLMSTGDGKVDFTSSLAKGLLEYTAKTDYTGTDILAYLTGDTRGMGSDSVATGGGIRSVTDSTGGANPFATLTSIGHTINAATLHILALLGMVNLFSQFVPTSSIFSPVSGILSIIGAGALALLMGSGYTLAYIIPFTPAVMWAMIVLGWTILLVEALIASPMAVVMMVTPEGEGVAGRKLERAISLLTVVLLKPSLSIMGLVVSGVVAYVGFGIFNQIYWDAVDLQTDAGIFELIAVLLLYTSGAMMVMKTSFSLMHKLPNNILEWMNTSGGRTFGEDNVDQSIEGASGKAGQKMEKAVDTMRSQTNWSTKSKGGGSSGSSSSFSKVSDKKDSRRVIEVKNKKGEF